MYYLYIVKGIVTEIKRTNSILNLDPSVGEDWYNWYNTGENWYNLVQVEVSNDLNYRLHTFLMKPNGVLSYK